MNKNRKTKSQSCKNLLVLPSSKISFFSILKILGIILHVPAIMALLSILICLIYKEYFAITPLLLFALVTLFIAQLLCHIFSHHNLHNLKEAMIGAALGWALCSLIGALPYWLISNKLITLGISNEPINIFSSFLNCIFESVSGFTSTGLTMTTEPSKLSHVLQWWRSFQAWVGGMGLVIFIISLVEPKKEEYRLYLAEAKSEYVGKNIRLTLQKTWFIYLIYTLCLVFLFYLAKMPLWDAINHGMNALATGGFSIADKNLGAYSLPAQVVALFGMTVGAISFSLHYRLFKDGKISTLWTSLQHRLLFIFLIIGSSITILLNCLPEESLGISKCIFSWFSSLTTCGFSNVDMSYFSAAGKLFFILAMVIGGSSGSTAGGLKIRRIHNLFSAILLRLKSMTKAQEEEIIEELEEKEKNLEKNQDGEIAEIKLPPGSKSSRLYSSTVLFLLWIFFLIFSWFVILLIEPNAAPIHALFDLSSALGNVGLSTNIVSSALTMGGKWIFIFLMWLGRLEIIPFIILLSSISTLFCKNEKSAKLK